MRSESIDLLPEVLKAKEARDVLRIDDDEAWSAVVEANPQIVLAIPGLKRNRYRKTEVLKLIGK